MTTDKILLDHGGGGKMSHRLISEMVAPLFKTPHLEGMNDGAVFDAGGRRIAFSTDSYTVDPIRFPGGDIGELAVNGTVNDIAMCGGEPAFLSLGLIIEEGFPLSDLEDILKSIARSAERAGVSIVTGDTKVVPNGAADKIYINTSGVGWVPDHVFLDARNARAGDLIILSGSIADHGMTVLTLREGLTFSSSLKSDTAPLNHMVKRLLSSVGGVHVLRDPTRGGLGTALNEIALQSKVGVEINEADIPVRPEAAGACELLGFDPLYVANEGKLIAFVSPDDADKALQAVRNDEFGKSAAVIGRVVSERPGKVYMKTTIGGTRIVDMLAGEQLPRIC